MEALLEKYKGIHPGLILDRELKKRNLKKGPFALSLPEYPQTITAIIKGRRLLTAEVSLKIDRALELEEGTMYLLQAYYSITEEIKREQAMYRPDLNLLRKSLFWDTDIEKLDWQKQYKTIIKRIFERGDDQEKKAISDFYGSKKIKEVTGRSSIVENSLPIM
ncbi:helix-turn-helix transcriptional regulator [Pedobacter miscanthi]|uniref:Plasmid maintenance system antidote protein n=1 Tax=Pedobacter miscanthi TaxID=2259170 RepID=A0A366L1E4_9SPHI|nr:plasmid maintenance system antidote protein [Pedobacter miscanthi]RBQ07600.1 plasmid maintenance system antidote protein [Pedobacter miscanthi]